jgi:hypothetical protein
MVSDSARFLAANLSADLPPDYERLLLPRFREAAAQLHADPNVDAEVKVTLGADLRRLARRVDAPDLSSLAYQLIQAGVVEVAAAAGVGRDHAPIFTEERLVAFEQSLAPDGGSDEPEFLAKFESELTNGFLPPGIASATPAQEAEAAEKAAAVMITLEVAYQIRVQVTGRTAR